MARIRTIKPEFFRHEGLQDLEIANPGNYVMLVFAALWGHCDKAGRFEWKPRTLKLDILPFLPFDMAKTLEILRSAGVLNCYESDGKTYGEIPSFEKHQRLGGKEAQEPEKHPPPPVNNPGSNGEATGKQLPAQEGKGREGNGVKEGSGEGSAAADAPAAPSAEKPAAKKPRKPKADHTLADWLATLPADDPAIRDDDPLWEWATSASIPEDWIGIAWRVFEARYRTGTGAAKRYADWRSVFRQAVRDDWLKAWRMTPTGPVLTTVGEQYRRAA